MTSFRKLTVIDFILRVMRSIDVVLNDGFVMFLFYGLSVIYWPVNMIAIFW